MMEDLSFQTGIQIYDVNEKFDFASKEYILQIQIELNRKKDTYNKTYKKIQDVLAEVGGIITALLTIARIILKPI